MIGNSFPCNLAFGSILFLKLLLLTMLVMLCIEEVGFELARFELVAGPAGCRFTGAFNMSYSSFSFLPRTMLNANLVPLPNLDFTPMAPSNAFTIFSDITRPRPIP
jgi:hypothetical protein